MLAFIGAVFFLIVTPGPGVLTTAGVGSGFGFKPGLAFVTGLWVGNNLVGLAVVSGIAAIVLSVPEVRLVLSIMATAYLLYLACRIALSGSRIAFMERQTPPGALGGVMLQMINPKAYAVNTNFFAGFAFMPDNLLLETVLKFAIMNAFWIPIHLGWLAAGVALRRLDLDPRIHRFINIAMALSMLAVVGLTGYATLSMEFQE